MSASPVHESLSALPAEIRQELDKIRAAGRGPFGRNQTQSIVTRHLGLLATLRDEYGATHTDVAALLQSCGITCADGKALTAATLSSAISRAKARSARSATRVTRRPPTRNAPPAPAAQQQPEGLDRGDPPPGLAMISTGSLRRQAAADDAGRPHQLLAPGREAPGIRAEDHHTRLIELLQTMEN
jgi:hypothetical protein